MATGYLVTPPLVVSPKATVSAHAASGALTSSDMGKIHTNTGAAATIALTLPAASAAGGFVSFRVMVLAAFSVRVTPAAGEKVYLAGSGVASKYAEIAGVVGNYLDVSCDGVDWLVTHWSGVATKEA